QGFTKNSEGTLNHLVFIPHGLDRARTTVLIRTPYFGNSLQYLLNTLVIPFALKQVNVVIQPTRGTHLSSGEFKYFDLKSDIEDAKNILNWLRDKKWNKDVVAHGFSYDGYMAMTTVATGDPMVKAAFLGAPIGLDGFSSRSVNDGYAAYGKFTSRDWVNLQAIGTKLIRETQKPYVEDNSFGIPKYQTEKMREKEAKLITLVNKTRVPLFFNYGLMNDHVSRSTIHYYNKVTNPKLLVTHQEFHNSKPLDDLFTEILSKKTEDRSFTEIINIYPQVTTFILKDGKPVKKAFDSDKINIDPNIELDNFATNTEKDYAIHYTLLPPGSYNGLYEVEIEFQDDLPKEGTSLAVALYKSQTGEYQLLERSTNAWVIDATKGKRKYILKGNSIFFENNSLENYLMVQVNKEQFSDKIPVVKSLKARLQRQEIED
ncbi:X-Pro dipeptidyl-peptidase S15 family, partial [Bacteriovorax sp. DB6_IX]|uniref:X-Pro dipeptidyl-peptidase S15 family n=1 Tax=Bacteriovorax sp. DB6_IX TaxID=1353530 RepID=UPI00038A2E7C